MISTSPPREPPAATRSGPWTLRTWAGRLRVTAACTLCGAVPWDEPLGMTATFTSISQAREELPRDWGWPVAALPGGAELVLCPGCADRLTP